MVMDTLVWNKEGIRGMETSITKKILTFRDSKVVYVGVCPQRSIRHRSIPPTE